MEQVSQEVITCKAFTKGGSRCKTKSNLVDGICQRHRDNEEVLFKCTFVISRGSRKGRECGSAADESLRCKKHYPNSFMIFKQEVSGEISLFGPFRKLFLAEKAQNILGSGGKIVKVTPFEFPEDDEEEEKLQCEHVFNKGNKIGKRCSKIAVKGGVLCQKHTGAPIDEEALRKQKETPNEGGCVHIIQRGKNRGLECRKKVVEGTDKCQKHSEATISAAAKKRPKTKIPTEKKTSNLVKPRPASDEVKQFQKEVTIVKGSGQKIQHTDPRIIVSLDLDYSIEDCEEDFEIDIGEMDRVYANGKDFTIERLDKDTGVTDFFEEDIYESIYTIFDYLDRDAAQIKQVTYNGRNIQVKTR